MSIIPQDVPQGAIRYNTDSNKMECFDGTRWMQVSVSSPVLANRGIRSSGIGTDSRNEEYGGARGLFMGNFTEVSPGYTPSIDYVDISSTGNAIDFGDLITVEYYGCACSSSTRGLYMGGEVPTSDIIQYVTISSTGNAIDFGDLTEAVKYMPAGGSNETRGIRSGGVDGPNSNPFNTIDYVTIASTGNAKDFGDLTTRQKYPISVNSPTRMLIAGGVNVPGHPSANNTIEYLNFATYGNTAEFGDLTQIQSAGGAGAACSSTRGIFFVEGYISGGWSNTNVINYVTMASTGNAVDFGDLTFARKNSGSTSSKTRALCAGGYYGSSPNYTNAIEYIEIATTGNAVDFGDRTVAGSYFAGCSNAHGGL